MIALTSDCDRQQRGSDSGVVESSADPMLDQHKVHDGPRLGRLGFLTTVPARGIIAARSWESMAGGALVVLCELVMQRAKSLRPTGILV